MCNASVQIWHGISSSFSANFVRGHILYNVQYILCLYTVQCTLCTEQNLLYSLQNARQIVLIFITRAVTQIYLKFSLFRKSIKNVDENALCLAEERLKMPSPICRLKLNLIVYCNITFKASKINIEIISHVSCIVSRIALYNCFLV